MKRLLSVAAVALLSACGSSSTDDEPSDDEEANQRAQLTGAYVGTWEGELTASTGEDTSFTLVVTATETVAPACGTVDLGAGVDTRCITVYQMIAHGTLTTADGRFSGLAAEGTLSNLETRFELPNAGYVAFQGTSGSYSYGEGAARGTFEATRK